MSYAQARRDIETHFASAWNKRTPAGMDGHSFTPSVGSVRLTIIDGEGRQASAGDPGSNLARYAGVVAVQVYTQGGQGTAASRALEDAVCAVFRNADLGSIRFGIPYVSGSLEDEPFLIRTIMAPFQADVFHA